MPGRHILSILLLAAVMQVTSQTPDLLGINFVTAHSPETSKIRNEYKNQETPKNNTSSRYLCTPDFKNLSERETKLAKDKSTQLNHAIVDTAKVLHNENNHSSHNHKVSDFTIASRLSDKDVDISQVEKYRILNAEETNDDEDVSDKSFLRYFDSYRQKPKDMRVVTRPNIMYQQSVNHQSTTKKTTTSPTHKSSPITSGSGFSTNSYQSDKKKVTTSRPYNGYQTTNYYGNGKISSVTPGTNNGGTSRPPNVYTSTTQNPFFNGPGVKPAPVYVDRPPFTNRPFTQRPNYGVTRPIDADAILFPEDPDSGAPELISGRDEESMSYDERRRFEEIAEKMCDKYKASETRQLEAIPLLPSPEPVRVNISDCAPRTIPLIVGGKVATIKDFPHMALLGWPKLQVGGYSWKCGGSLISEQYILTAAHCANQERDNTVVTGPPRAAQLGSTFLDDPGALVVKVSSVIRHPKYKAPRSYYDIALVKLATPVKFSERIKPACLGSPPSPGDSVIATGWGRTESEDQSEELRSVSIPIWDIEDCWTTLGTSKKLPNGPVGENQICAGERKGGKDTCQGDSGGPAQIQDGCVWRVVAVTSVGRGCGAPHTPGVYAIANAAFIASIAFENQNVGDRYEQRTNQNGRGQAVNYNDRPPKTNSVTESYNRGGNGNFNSGSISAGNVQNNFVNDFPQDGYRHNNQRRSNGYEVYDIDNDEDSNGWSNPSWTRLY